MLRRSVWLRASLAVLLRPKLLSPPRWRCLEPRRRGCAAASEHDGWRPTDASDPPPDRLAARKPAGADWNRNSANSDRLTKPSPSRSRDLCTACAPLVLNSLGMVRQSCAYSTSPRCPYPLPLRPPTPPPLPPHPLHPIPPPPPSPPQPQPHPNPHLYPHEARTILCDTTRCAVFWLGPGWVGGGVCVSQVSLRTWPIVDQILSELARFGQKRPG